MLKVFISVLVTLQVLSTTEALQSRPSLRHTSALKSVGSDVLQRPNDENSAEYREYLKNLMRMQANRARGGHAAPSSGSSDAYFAKLTRLKIERKALKDAGLPDDLLDTGYTQDDYDSAIYESQEPLVASAVLTGEAAVASRDRKSSAKVRSKTTEEIAMTEAAERTVEMARLRQEALPPGERAHMKDRYQKNGPRPPVLGENTPDVDLIDQVLAGRSLIQLRPQVMSSYTEAAKQKQEQKNTPPAPVARQAAPVAKAAPAPVARAVPPPPPPAPVAKAAPVASAVPLRPLPPKAAPVPRPVMKTMPASAPVQAPAPVAVAAQVADGRKLRNEDLELMAKSLQMLIKHRGGGPFGAGRLSTVKEIANLEIALRDTADMLISVDGVAAPVAVAAPVKQVPVAVKQALAPVRAPAPAPVAAPVRAAAPVPVAAPVQAPVQAVVDAPMEQDERAPITIAQGLDQFLLAPKLRSEEELAGLRDGLIQCLYLVQQELGSRPPVEQVAVNVEEEKVVNDNEALQRIMRINAPAMVSPTQEGEEESNQIPVEQDVKLALGLLLKHRGGPGFGHGRLVGKELDLMAQKLRSVSQRLVAEAVNQQ